MDGCIDGWMDAAFLSGMGRGGCDKIPPVLPGPPGSAAPRASGALDPSCPLQSRGATFKKQLRFSTRAGESSQRVGAAEFSAVVWTGM